MRLLGCFCQDFYISQCLPLSQIWKQVPDLPDVTACWALGTPANFYSPIFDRLPGALGWLGLCIERVSTYGQTAASLTSFEQGLNRLGRSFAKPKRNKNDIARGLGGLVAVGEMAIRKFGPRL